MRVVVLIVQFTTLFGLVAAAADFWTQVEDAKFSFAKGYDNGARETKRIVHDYIKLFGVPLEGGQYGLFITPGRAPMLESMTAALRAALQDYRPPPFVQTVLEDPFNMRENIIATTENDYTHALHGMFMLVINTMLRTAPFSTQVKQYTRDHQLDRTMIPMLGAQRATQSLPSRYFFPDWLVSFPKAATSKTVVLQPKEILRTVEFKMGGSAFKTACNTLDDFFAKGGRVAAMWSADPKVPEGVIHYVPIVDGKPMQFKSVLEANKYDLMFGRILEAAATALWADTKVTLFAANSQYFAAGPARGYGASNELKAGTPSANKRDGAMDDLIDDQCSSPSKVKSIKDARNAARNAKANEPFVVGALSAPLDVPVNSKVIYLPSYGSAKRPATLLAHVLALTYDKLKNGLAESKSKLDHSARAAIPTTAPVPVGGKHVLEGPSTADRSSKKAALETLDRRGA